MSRRSHAPQHKPGRESKAVEQKNELQRLRSENQQLKRKLAKLRRKNDELYEREIITDPLEVESTTTTPTPVTSGCPKGCQAVMRTLTMPSGKKLKVCPECGARTIE